MGKVSVEAKIENLDDLVGVRKGRIGEGQARVVIVPDALIDTGASGLLIPRHLIDQLGLDPLWTRQSRTVSGSITLTMYDAVRLTIQGRQCACDVAAISDDLPVIVGQLPLEAMDWVVDMKGRRLIGNPEHGGEDMAEIL